MSGDGIQLRLKGTTFKLEFVPIIGGVLETAGKTILAVATGGLSLTVAPNLVTGLFSALKGVKLNEDSESRAWLLISGGLIYALEKSIAEIKLDSEPPSAAFKQLILDLGTRIETRNYTVEQGFFSTPNTLDLLDDVAHELSAWVSPFGGNENPKEARRKLERYFPAGLHRTWMKDVGRFEPLEQALNSPFASSLKAQKELDGYLQYLEEQFTELRLIGQDEDDPKGINLASFCPPKSVCRI